MSGTSFIIVGFSFATLNGCEQVLVSSELGPLIQTYDTQGRHQLPLAS